MLYGLAECDGLPVEIGRVSTYIDDDMLKAFSRRTD